MKKSRHQKNQRLAFVGKYPSFRAALEDPAMEPYDVDQFVLTTLTALKKAPAGVISDNMRRQVEGWTPPRFQCPICHSTGLLSDCPRVANKHWCCPSCGSGAISHDPVVGEESQPEPGQ